ncbi:hypothetical protein B0H17DRAFT_345218 [Mycena rosella]|uniref:Zn(2)-C6 fungal-type domain-containing protein n=1 Tax=Mycena rosella TaxID=1033263 RepID=A0AAD7CQW2_MYCRO|nr:hypothetical protein B0H17DRAFT_345218 [Mycena rosella]
MEAKLKTPTCNRCKIRKIRCDGLSSCYTCATAGASCEYDDDSKDGRSASELRKGAACLTCRRKKKKCDGKFPCRTCAAARKKINCEYPDGIVVTVALEESHGDVLRMPADSVSSLDSTIRDNTTVTLPFTPSGTPESAHSSSSTGSPPYITIPVDMLDPPDTIVDICDIQSPSPFALPEAGAPHSSTYITLAELTQARNDFIEDTVKRGLDASTLISQAQDDEMRDTESPSQADDSSELAHSPYFQVEAPAPGSNNEDELTQIRKLFLSHRIQLGLSVMDCGLEALANGSIAKSTCTNSTLHPVLLHACQLMGYMLARHLQRNTWFCLPGQSEREAEQTRLALASLHQLGRGPCPLAYLQTSTLLVLYFFNKGDIARSRSILCKASQIVLDHDLDTTMLYAGPLVPAAPAKAMSTAFKSTLATRAEEGQAALSQLIYLDLSQRLLLQLPSVIAPQVYTHFKTVISRPNAQAEINYVRAKSAFLLFEAQELAAEWSQSGLAADQVTAWQTRYWDLMEALDAHRSFLTLTLTRVAFCPAYHTLGLSLKVCVVLVLTGLSVLHTLFSADQIELRRKKYEAIAEIINISATFSEEDCEYLDPILSVCWTAIIGTLDHCIALGPEAVTQSMHDIPAMASTIRQRNKTLQRVLPFALDMP